jgi:type IV pilus assembly protein PilM
LIDIIRESAVTAKRAVFAMPLSLSFVTNVSIEAAPDADISALVRVEARKVIPASLSEVTLDWAEVETAQEAKDTKDKKDKKDDETPIKRNILIAAIQNAALERFKVLMQFIQIKEPPTEIECFSVIRSLNSTADKDVAIIDIGAISTKLYIGKNGLLMRMHRIRAGGAIATNRIASVLNSSFEEAELKKQNIRKTDKEYSDIKRAHDSSYERAFREFAQVLREYETKNDIKITSVYLSGGGAMFPGIETLVQDILGRQIVRAHPFAKVSYPAFMQDTLKEIGPTFAVALGAALRSFE